MVKLKLRWRKPCISTWIRPDLHPAFNALMLALDSRAEAEGIEPDKAFKLHIANALWGQQGFPFVSDFLDTLALNYGAGMYLVDFQNQP